MGQRLRPALPLLLALLLAACVAARGTASVESNRCCRLSLQDNGHSVVVSRGSRIELRLQGSRLLPWSAPRSNSRILVRTGLQRRQGTVTAIFLARGRGRATLRSEQTPACRRATPPCELPERLFLVHVRVR